MSRSEDARFLGIALDLALRAEGRTRPNPMVGALVVRDGEVVGWGYHARAGGEHAEISAITQAGEAARGATLYSSLEPCCTQGRTPPCVDGIIAARIRRVVASMQDPNPLVDGRGFTTLRSAGIAVDVGLLEEEARRVNRAFSRFMTAGRPWITIKAGVTLDGKIAASDGRSRWITSPDARAEAMRLRDRHDAVLVGVNTVIVDDPLLSVREPLAPRAIHRVVLDSTLRTPPGCRLLRSSGAGPVIVYHTAGASMQRAAALQRAGAETVRAGQGSRVDLDRVLADLARREVLSVVVEGGGSVIGSFLSSGKADSFSLFVAPSLLGSGGVALVSGWDATGPEAALRLCGMTARRIGADVLVEGEASVS